MMRSLMDLLRYEVTAIDGEVGYVVNFLLDDERWAVRYLVVQTRGPLFPDGRRVLISPISFLHADWLTHRFHVALTKEVLAKSPTINADQPVSRAQERAFDDYYGLKSYWHDEHGVPPSDVLKSSQGSDMHLRSAEEIVGYRVQGTDDTIGHIENFIVDDATWQLRYLVINTRNWWFGKKVLVAPHWATQVGWKDGTVYIDLPRQTIKDSPEWNPSAPVNREYETRLYDYYGRPAYWGKNEPSTTITTPPPSISAPLG